MQPKVRWMIAVVMVIGLALVFLLPTNRDKNYKEKYEGINLSSEIEGLGRENTYTKYLEVLTNETHPDKDIEVDLLNIASGKGIEILDQYEGVQNVIQTSDAFYGEWEVDVPQGGLYQLYVEYYPVSSRGVDIERKIYINGEIPFSGADTLSFTRLWGDKGEVKKDNQGNEIRPTQVEIPKWVGSYFKDTMGYYVEPYLFYFEKGHNTIALEAINEPMIMKSLTLKAVNESKDYKTYRESQPKVVYSEEGLNYKQVIQGEASALRTSPSLYATYDRSSSNTEPYSVSKICLNMGGGNAWRVPGQWMEWEFTVPENGYYNITIKGRQNYQRGFVSNRALYIDGEIPFEELEAIGFRYSNEWESVMLSSEEDIPYEFYLTEGKHTLRLEVTLGELGLILSEVEDNVYRLNEIYRKILVLTGTMPDRFRDYKIAQVYPEVITAMDLESKRLFKVVDEIVAYSGQKASQVAAAQTLAVQLEEFVEDPDKIPVALSVFKQNISALGTSILAMSEAPLDIDYITINGLNEHPNAVNETFVDKAVHEMRSFTASFFEDYNSLGDVYSEDESIEVWILTGRDQSTILKTMIDDTFTPETNIKVNVKLVEAGTLLNAVIAGTGPDVVLSVGQGEPVNYALRNAVEDLSQFEDYEEVFAPYYESAYMPYRFEGGVYALPETQNYNVLFYRTDILDELSLEIPNTWDDLINMLSTIQQNNMSVAIPSVERTVGNVSLPDLSALIALLYQNGGQLYEDDGKYTVIDESSGVNAFETFTKLFTHYNLPTQYDFVNRFRSGEMPIGIQDYSTYNTLVVFAPEIRGLWDFTLIPGTLQEDGTINRSSYSSGVCSMILKQKDNNKKAMCWEFLKWWGNADTQVRFGREMESIMGASARYATANREAFKQLAWSSSQVEVLEKQWEWAEGINEVAGGYYTFRHITNAVRKVVNDKDDPRETLLDYARTINEEIEKKRLEFGLEIN